MGVRFFGALAAASLLAADVVYEAFNADHSDLVFQVHLAYLQSGARCLSTLDAETRTAMNNQSFKRMLLSGLAAATLGTGKSGHGLQAIDWYRNGQWDLLIKYCRQDVKVTKDVYEFGRDNGFLYIPKAGSRRRIDVRIDG